MPSSRREWVLGACMALVLLVVWSLRIGPEEVTKDAGQTLQLAVNLHDHGILAEEREAPFTPSMVREPLPAVLGAAFVGIANALYGPAERVDDYF